MDAVFMLTSELSSTNNILDPRLVFLTEIFGTFSRTCWTLTEEKKTDEALTQLAESNVNRHAEAA